MNDTEEALSIQGGLGRLNLLHGVFDLLLAGTETSSTTISWSLLYLAKYPDIQMKLYREIKSAFGITLPGKPKVFSSFSSEFPSLQEYSERFQCPYAEAFIHEVQRKGDIVPMSLSHKATRDFVIPCPKTGREYRIPKGTQVIPFISSALKDKDHFSDPETFRPERFIDQDGKFVPDPMVNTIILLKFLKSCQLPIFQVIPFGIGKRKCLGETLARMTLFHFMTGIVQRFRITPAPGESLSEKPMQGLTATTAPFKIILTPR